jgi:nucleoid-associated protein YgaU
MIKRRLLTTIFGLALIGALQGCSSGGLQDGEIQGDEVPPSGDAATDPVPPAGDAADLDKVAAATPQDGLEQPPPDPNAAPPDPNAAPPDPAAAPETPPDKVTPPPTVAEAPPEPVKETAPPPKEVVKSDGGDYTVVAGDTLMKIAFEHYGDLYKWKEIFELNRDKITNPNSIPKGTVLKLNPGEGVAISRNGEKYLIKSGDTLGTISRDLYGTTSKWKKIWKNNRELIKDPNRIFAGFYLYYTITDEEKQNAPAVRSQPVAKESGGGDAASAGDAPREPASTTAAPATPPGGGSGPG